MTTSAGVRSALVLAGGLGTRLRSVVPDIPKVLAPVAGTPFLAYVLRWLGRWGISDVVLCLGYKAEMVVAAAPGLAPPGQRLHFSVESSPQGTAGALLLARRWAQGRVVAMNGDSLPVVDLDAMLAAHARHGGLCTLAAAHVPEAARFGAVDVAPDGLVRAFGTGPVTGPGLVNAGVYVLEDTAWAYIRGHSFEREALPGLASLRGLYAYSEGVRFMDMGTPDGYSGMEAFLGGERA